MKNDQEGWVGELRMMFVEINMDEWYSGEEEENMRD